MSVSVSDFSKGEQIQLTMFDREDKGKTELLNHVVDQIREKYGVNSILRGTFANCEIDPVQGGVNDGNYIMMGGYRQ